MNISDWITIVGWPISLVITILGTVVVETLIRKKRKIISWDKVGEISIVRGSLLSSFGVPIKVLSSLA